MSLFMLIILFTIITLLISKFSSSLISLIVRKVYKESAIEKNWKIEVGHLKKELNTIPIVDEFPRYARVERQIKKLSNEINIKSQSRTQDIFIGKFVLSIIFSFLQLLLSAVIIWMFRSQSVIEIESQWFYPIGGLLSMPSGESGVVSAFAWVIICRCAISQVVGLVGRTES